MRQLAVSLFVAWMLSWSAPVVAQDTQVSGDEVKVKLVIVDTLVMNKQGVTVPDLTQDDFKLTIGGEDVEIDTFDLHCPGGAVADPLEVKKWTKPRAKTPGIELSHKIVFVIDYYSLSVPDRKVVLDSIQAMLQLWKPEKEEVMIAAIADGLRIEQRFTTDRQALLRTLRRMEHDITLWAREFTTTSGRLWFDDLVTLNDVLAAYDGSKGVVFFSDVVNRGSTTAGTAPSKSQDLWYQDVTQRATIARAAFYPTFSTGLSRNRGGGGSLDSLARLANETGGRMPPNTSFDLSISYARAQRDLSCRYSLGVYVDPDEVTKPKKLRVHVDREDTQVRFPESIRLWSDDEIRKSRESAAFADPENFESALVRAFAFPIRMKSNKSWDTLLAGSFDVPVPAEGIELQVGATLSKNQLQTTIAKATQTVAIPAPADGKAGSVPVTVIGDRTLKAGQYYLTVVASLPGGKERVASAQVDITVPQIPEGLIVLRGPILARIVRNGILVRADKKDDETNPNLAVLKDLMGEHGSFEPLLVHQVESVDTIVSLWEACTAGKGAPEGPAVVERRIVGEDGQVALQLDPVPLEMQGNKKIRCAGKLDHFEASELGPGEYTVEVEIKDTQKGDLIAKGSVPLLVEEGLER